MLGLYAFTGLWTRCNAKWILVGAVACISKSIKGIFKNSYVAQLGGAEQDLNAPIHPYSEETKFSGVMVVPPLPQCSGAFKMEFREDGKRIEGDWPVYFHTLLPLYKEEIHCYYTDGLDVLLQKLMKNGVEAAFDFNRENTCK